MENIYDKIQESANFIESKSEVKPSIGLILGSGLGVLADEIQNPVKIKYNESQTIQKRRILLCQSISIKNCPLMPH